jgi:sensor c-di-GMP phosphodiesterase-like protein
VTRRSRLAVYAVLAAAVALLPVTAMHVLAGRRARQRGEAELGRTADAVLERAELIFSRTEESLKSLQPGVDASCPEHTIANLRRAVFRDRYIREVGIVDASGRLVCTSWGPVAAPPVISEALRRAAGAPGLAVRGPARTAIMGDPSLILSLPLAGGGEVNALVDPEELVFTAKDSGLGPSSGGLAVSGPDGSILAAHGPGDAAAPAGAGGFTLARSSPRFGLHVAATARPEWLMRSWERDLPAFLAIGTLASLGMLAVVFGIARRRLSFGQELSDALRRGEFALHYLPVIDLSNGRCTGAEALLRWSHPERGLVRPDLFIPLAEETGVILPLTLFVVKKAAEDLEALIRERPDFRVTINLSALHLRSEDALGPVLDACAKSGLGSSRFVFEVTEREALSDASETVRTAFDRIRSIGATVVLDDFGMGYGSLDYLNRFHFDGLKIDRSFVAGIGTGSLKVSLVDAVVAIGRSMRLVIVAEGVETEAQRRYLEDHGVRLVQGHLFQRAAPAADLAAFLAAH